MESAVNYALRTVLARSKSNDFGSTSNTIGNSTVNMDVSRLKKRIQTLCERLEKGGSLVSSESYGNRSDSPERTLTRATNSALELFDQFWIILASYSSSSMSNRRGKASASNSYSSQRETNNHDDVENGLGNDDYGSKQRKTPWSESFVHRVICRYISSFAIG